MILNEELGIFITEFILYPKSDDFKWQQVQQF